MTAATTPPRTDGTTTVFTISQRVAPRPIDAFLELRRHAEEELAADRRRDRDGHDRQHDDRGEHGRLDLVLAVARRSGSSRAAAQERLHVLRVERREHDRCPRARRRPRHRGEHLDQRADRPADRRRRELAEEEADRDRERRGDEHRAERRDDRADDQVARAELVRDGVPVVVPDEAEVEDLDRRPGARRRRARRSRDDDRRRSAPRARSARRAATSPMRSAEAARARERPSGAGPDAASTRPAFQRLRAPEDAVTTSTHDVHILCTPARAERA